MRPHPLIPRSSRSVAAVLCALAAAACGGEPGATPAVEVARDTIGDTIVVRTLAGSAWGDTARLTPDLVIGQFEGPDEYVFGSVRALAVAPDGSIYIFDSQVPALRKYAPDGTYVTTFGREGQGPGEYKNPDGLAVLPDGRVLLRDPGNARVTVYAPDGQHMGSWKIRGGYNTSRRFYVDTAGHAYTSILLDPTADITEWRTGLVRHAPDGTPLDTLESPTWDYEPPRLLARKEGSSSSRSVPFTPDTEWAFSPLGYMVGGVSTRYAIDLYRPDAVLRIGREIEPVRVKPDEKEERRRIVTAQIRISFPSWTWNGPDIPDTKPPFRDFFIGDRGRIWVALSQDSEKIEREEPSDDRRIPEPTWVTSGALFDVFEPDGTYLGIVRAESFSTYPAPTARGDTVWAVTRDELDVPYVTRFVVAHDAQAASD